MRSLRLTRRLARLRGLLTRRRALRRLLLLTRLHLKLLLALQGLLTLRRRLFVPRHFIQLRRRLTHIRLHLLQQLALFVGELRVRLDLAARRRFSRRRHRHLTVLQLFNIFPALFRLRRQAVAVGFMIRDHRHIFFFMMRKEP